MTATIALPVLAALFAWWFATGAILYLDGLPRSTYRHSMMSASLLALLALVGLAVTSRHATPAGAYLAFVCGIRRAAAAGATSCMACTQSCITSWHSLPAVSLCSR
jgi:putative photosynthetic complex assembly protein 2